MKIVGIICEYNPFHNGHARQIRLIRERWGDDCAVVCLMSGNFVQRGHPAVYHKMVRARAALESGADLVLELPVTYALRSAEGFAAGGVEILGKFCDGLCFGAETDDAESLMALAGVLLSEEYVQQLRQELTQGVSFPVARERAVRSMGRDSDLLRTPNNILGVEYCKAIIRTGTGMQPMLIHRPGGYHDTLPQSDHPSATAVRGLIEENRDIRPYIPQTAASLFADAGVHTQKAGERAVLARLRTMTETEFECIPFGSEGLWRKLMHESRRQPDLENIITAVKSKRYTWTRIERMILCAYLGITRQMLEDTAPYTRILGFTDRGREVLHYARKRTPLCNIGQKTEDPYQILEQRCADLYGLFACSAPEAPGMEESLRVVYKKLP